MSRGNRGAVGAALSARLAREDEHPLPLRLSLSLTVLEKLYRILYHAARFPYQTGLQKPRHPGLPTVCLGNLTVGGTGKTSASIWLANALYRAGRRPSIISHGYKSANGNTLLVSDGNTLATGAESAGDEARLAALACPGVSVASGRDRIAASGLVRAFDADSLVVDDAFQHWRLRRDLDLVLLDAERPFGNGRLLPRGWLREPVTALNRADAIILVGKEGRMPAGLPRRPVFQAFLEPSSMTRFEDWRCGLRTPVKVWHGPAAVFCGLARPDRFCDTLSGLGAHITSQLILPDHEAPCPNKFAAWLRGVNTPIVTSEKDAVKLGPALQEILAGHDLWVLGVAFCPLDEAGLLGFVLEGLNKAEAAMLQSPAGICTGGRF